METTLVLLVGDNLMMDKNQVLLVILLDLSVAFDTANHAVLATCLQTLAGPHSFLS